MHLPSSVFATSSSNTLRAPHEINALLACVAALGDKHALDLSIIDRSGTTTISIPLRSVSRLIVSDNSIRPSKSSEFFPSDNLAVVIQHFGSCVFEQLRADGPIEDPVNSFLSYSLTSHPVARTIKRFTTSTGWSRTSLFRAWSRYCPNAGTTPSTFIASALVGKALYLYREGFAWKVIENYLGVCRPSLERKAKRIGLLSIASLPASVSPEDVIVRTLK